MSSAASERVRRTLTPAPLPFMPLARRTVGRGCFADRPHTAHSRVRGATGGTSGLQYAGSWGPGALMPLRFSACPPIYMHNPAHKDTKHLAQQVRDILLTAGLRFKFREQQNETPCVNECRTPFDQLAYTETQSLMLSPLFMLV